MSRLRSMWSRLALLWVAAALSPAITASVSADDIATLPLGEPSRAYSLGSGKAGQIISCVSGPAAPVTLVELVEDLAKVDVVIIGEHHTNMEGHRIQWQMLKALAQTERSFALGMEFFEIQDDEALARYVRSDIDLAKMLDETAWYGGGSYNFEYYRPLVETARTHNAPIYGLNIPRDWVRVVSRQGAEAMSAEQRAAVGMLGPVNERHKYVVNQMMGGIGAAMPEMFDGMYRGQTAWDSAMATSIVRAHQKHVREGTPRTIVVIVGSGHMAHGLAIPARLRALDPSLTIRTIGPVVGTKPDEDAQVHPGFERKETAVFSLGYADYVYILPDDGNAQEYPPIGVRMDYPKGAATPTATPLRITSVGPGSIGERAGLRVNDAVLLIGDEKPLTPRHAGAILATLRWDDRVTWRVSRPGVDGELAIAMLVVPGSDADGDWLKSKPASSLLDTFDPASDRSYLEPRKPSPATAYARLVTFRDKAMRVDVMRDGVLLEAWNLDEQGRPVLGLFSAPARDGAVRVEIVRGEDGRAISVRRLGADGSRITAPTAGPHADMVK